MTGVFEMMTGPYIPAEHVPLDVLPCNREEGYEVFSYPPELNDVDEALFEAEGLSRNECGARVALIYPYGYHSYGEYFAHLQGFVDKYDKTAPELADSIRRLIESIKSMNVKEDWSVVRYVGHEYDDKREYSGSQGDAATTGLARRRSQSMRASSMTKSSPRIYIRVMPNAGRLFLTLRVWRHERWQGMRTRSMHGIRR